MLRKTQNQLDRLEVKIEAKVNPLLQTIESLNASEKSSLLNELKVRVFEKLRKVSKVVFN